MLFIVCEIMLVKKFLFFLLLSVMFFFCFEKMDIDSSCSKSVDDRLLLVLFVFVMVVFLNLSLVLLLLILIFLESILFGFVVVSFVVVCSSF